MALKPSSAFLSKPSAGWFLPGSSVAEQVTVNPEAAFSAILVHFVLRRFYSALEWVMPHFG